MTSSTTNTTNATNTALVVREISVRAPLERAFSVFTEGMATWWPEDHHLLQAELAEMVVEPFVGGHIFDRGVDGSECRWARVLAFDPPTRFVFSWDINLAWEVETDPDKTSEIEVGFSADGPDRTTVRLEHRLIDRHGDGWEEIRDAVGSPGGWGQGLRHYTAAAEAAAGSDASGAAGAAS